MTDAPFSSSEQERYQRHIQLPGFARAGQQRLKQSHVVIIGLGGLGCPAAQYLTAAGTGQLTLVDGDVISLSNLQRQILFSEADIGRPKAEVATERLRQLNSAIQIEYLTEALCLDNAATLIAAADIVIDCTDNFHTRYLINDLCSHFATPWVYSSVLGFAGQLALFEPQHSCFRCLFPTLGEVPDCNQAGVLGVVPGTLGTLQALEAIKYLTGLGAYGNTTDAVSAKSGNRLQQFSALDLGLRSIKLGRSPDCDICNGRSDFRNHIQDYQPQCAALPKQYLLAADQLQAYVAQHQPQLIDVRSPQEHAQGNLGGVNIPIEKLTDTDALNADGCYLVYCQSGMRSQRAVQALLDKTDSALNIKSLQGGIDGQPAP